MVVHQRTEGVSGKPGGIGKRSFVSGFSHASQSVFSHLSFARPRRQQTLTMLSHPTKKEVT
jgi:hypothetical protein